MHALHIHNTNMYKKERSATTMFPQAQRRRTPSFSSTLLDSIYRSIDESNATQEQVLGIKSVSVSSSTTTRRDDASSSTFLDEEEIKEVPAAATALPRAVVIESWLDQKQSTTRGFSVLQYNSTCSSSSEYSSSAAAAAATAAAGGLFSSSENESSSRFAPQRAKPPSDKPQQKPKHEGGGFTKTKLRALKIYGELKKVKQPISPGGRIANFLNSIFSSASAAKKVKICSIGAMEDVSFERKAAAAKSSCSSVTNSFSRSCLISKTVPPRPRAGKPSINGGTKRSVRFYPVSVIVDEDSRPCGHKCIYEDDPGLMPIMPQKKVVKSNSVQEYLGAAATDYYLRSTDLYHRKKNVSEFDFTGYVEDDDNDSDSDDESCSSSDLFELDHLIIGINGRYREELPVYETTNFKTNQAIANGFIL